MAQPFVIMAHRGASGELPEHTLEAYQLALDQGADILEVDLVVTADGVLIARHDITLDASTNVADEFGAERMATKTVDGVTVTGYFVEDFTLTEIRTLKAVQSKDYRDQSFNDFYDIVTFEEVVALVSAHEVATGLKVGLFPEFKHPTYHRQSGYNIEQLFVDTLVDLGFTDPLRTKVQAFEIESLIRVKALLEAVGMGAVEIVQAMGKSRVTADPSKPFEVPYDVHFNVQQGHDLEAIYGTAIVNALSSPMSLETTWHDFISPQVLEAMRDTYLDGLSIWSRDIILRRTIEAPLDGDGNGIAEIRYSQTGEISTLVNDAQALGLMTYVFTLRDEERFQSLDWTGEVQTPTEEISLLAAIGLDGVVADYVDTAVAGAMLPSSTSFLVGTSDEDLIQASGATEVISTGNGNDRVFDAGGSDVVFLGAGNDYVRVGGGVDRFDGGAGTDYISYYDSTNGVTLDLQANTASGSWAVNDTIVDFESASGSRTGHDTISGTSGANTIRTYGGNDRVYDRGGADRVFLGAGNDYVRVGGGADQFDGGSGTDYISYYDSSNGITIDLATDTVSGSWGVNDTISNFESASGSGTGDDRMYGTSGSNTLKGFGGDDKLYGRSGDDKLYGGSGKDRFDGGAGMDRLWGGSGEDVFHLDFGEGHDTVEDFENNVDLIELDNFNFSDGQDAFDFATQVGDDVVFDFGNGDGLTVRDVTIGQLQNDLVLV